MIDRQYVHCECDVEGCVKVLNCAPSEVETSGWGIRASYATYDGAVRTYDLCPAHLAKFKAVREKQDKAIETYFRPKEQ